MTSSHEVSQTKRMWPAYPPRIAGQGGHLAVQSLGVLQGHERHSRPDMLGFGKPGQRLPKLGNGSISKQGNRFHLDRIVSSVKSEAQ